MTWGIYSDGYLDFERIYDTYTEDLILFTAFECIRSSLMSVDAGTRNVKRFLVPTYLTSMRCG